MTHQRASNRRTAASLVLLSFFLAAPLAAQRGDRDGHVMAEIWRDMEVPAAPVLSPEEGLASLRVAPGFRVELVAAEPLVQDPITLDWDEQGRMWLVEMRGFMPDVDGHGEQEPVGRVVVLEDVDGDGVMDKSTVFLDQLVLARALAIVDGGVLIGEPPHLWFCRDTDQDLVCDEKVEVGSYASDDPDALEHTENGLLQALDNWIYNAKSDRRFRFRDGKLLEEKTQFRGQWGIDQDDWGRLFYNTNSRYLLGDLFPSRYLARNDVYSAALPSGGRGVAERLVPDESVFTVRVNPGINRGYMERMLRPDGRLAITTSVSGLCLYRGDQFRDSYRGDVFIPEPAGNVVTYHRLQDEGVEIRSEHVTYPDPEWQQRDFLASTDERFRPVDCAIGPDGALYVVDMYRGILQHQMFVTTFLRKQILERGLDKPLGLGRIYRIVAEDRPYEPKAPDLSTSARQIAALSHPNGWVRDTAQRLLVDSTGDRVAKDLRQLVANRKADEKARVHALWTLEGRGELDRLTLKTALESKSPRLEIMALRASESVLADPQVRKQLLRRSRRALRSQDPQLRLQGAFSLGELTHSDPVGEPARNALYSLLVSDPDDVYLRQAAISGLGGFETEAATVLTRSGRGSEHDEVLRQLAEVAAARASSSATSRGEIEAKAGAGDDSASATDVGPSAPSAAAGAIDPERLAELVTRGRGIYSACTSCHAEQGQGDAGMGPRLAGSAWVLGSVERLVRIVLDGLEGPIEIDGEKWDDLMPGFRQDRRFTDDGVAALLTFLRNSWGHQGSAVLPEQVKAAREAIGERGRSWTVEELEGLP